MARVCPLDYTSMHAIGHLISGRNDDSHSCAVIQYPPSPHSLVPAQFMPGSCCGLSSLAPVSARMNPHRPSCGSDDHGLDKMDGSHGQVSSAAACFVSRVHWLSCAEFHT